MIPFKHVLHTLMLFISTYCIVAPAKGQQDDENHLMWSSTRRLKVSDFALKNDMPTRSYSYAHFMRSYQVHGFDFLARNLNKKVTNYMITSASYIDTSMYLAVSLIYQQTLFDLSEVYTRQFRKALKENKRKLTIGLDVVKEINEKNTVAHSKRQLDYDRETDFARNLDKQKEWEATIQKELNELSDFAYE